MKKLLLLLLAALIYTNLRAQHIDCDTRPTGKLIIFSQEQKDKIANAINAPFTVKIFVTVFADDDGSHRGATDENILRQIQNMANQYQPQNICFVLGGIRQVNNSDLNTHTKDTEAAEVLPFREPGFINIFIHNSLPGLNGTAYGIPNTYLSLSGGAIASLDNVSTLGHELGHCLGLYHTFETVDENGNSNKENVARAGACQNCATAGDVICDTPADDDGGVNAACVYIGGGKDACNVSYAPMTTNMMGYGSRPCRSIFTNGQGERMRTFLTTDPSLTPLVVQDIIYTPIFGNTTISSGTGYIFARDAVYVSDGSPNLTVNSTAVQFFQAKKVSLKSGTKFSPGTGGKVSVKSNPYCN
ncbi:M43 family zinc metalloprotease [Emticicia sp. BO119]|uniref:M43 family zinc metalloprotease n=1 Tax=Emticicia sp. BO119 TaxID=2757768 RepID=UPI0015F0ECEB|nr:M43 family zinc metalloprotease [Emticicia sp. BO119]MBA4851217.1 hypothetical protein [Emticicia sp. BO119]